MKRCIRFTEGTLDLTSVLSTEYPQFGMLVDPVRVRRARTLLRKSAEDFLAGLDSLSSEIDDQSDDLIMATGNVVELIPRLREIVEPIHALEGMILIPSGTGDDLEFNLNVYFNAPFDFQPFFPDFSGAFYVPNTFPDPTFGGTFPSVSNDDLTELFGIPREP